MEYSDYFGQGEVDGSGDMPTAAEREEYVRQVWAVLDRDAPARRAQPTQEYSASLVAQQDGWLQAQRQKTLGGAPGGSVNRST